MVTFASLQGLRRVLQALGLPEEMPPPEAHGWPRLQGLHLVPQGPQLAQQLSQLMPVALALAKRWGYRLLPCLDPDGQEDASAEGARRSRVDQPAAGDAYLRLSTRRRQASPTPVNVLPSSSSVA